MKGEKRVWRREDGCGGEKRAGKVRAARAPGQGIFLVP